MHQGWENATETGGGTRIRGFVDLVSVVGAAVAVVGAGAVLCGRRLGVLL